VESPLSLLPKGLPEPRWGCRASLLAKEASLLAKEASLLAKEARLLAMEAPPLAMESALRTMEFRRFAMVSDVRIKP
jgi:hypothetical protein